ncbi:MAG: hypothetical protein WC455_12250 [Dehalococcoidia bacterium]|jgi:hypothetical protein
MDTINEKESAVFSSTLYDDSGVVIPAAAINSFTVTLYDKATGNVINSRTAVDLYNAGAWTGSGDMVATVHATTGACTITLGSADNALYSATANGEYHILLIQLTTNATRPVTMKQKIEFYVENLTKVT